MDQGGFRKMILPTTIMDEEILEEMLSEPTEEVVAWAAGLEGDILVLGA